MCNFTRCCISGMVHLCNDDGAQYSYNMVLFDLIVLNILCNFTYVLTHGRPRLGFRALCEFGSWRNSQGDFRVVPLDVWEIKWLSPLSTAWLSITGTGLRTPEFALPAVFKGSGGERTAHAVPPRQQLKLAAVG